MSQQQSLLNDEIYHSVITSLCQDLGIFASEFFQQGLPAPEQAKKVLRAALQRDVTANLIEPDERDSASVICKEACVFVGKQWVETTFTLLADDITLTWHTHDGQHHQAGDTLFSLQGNTRAILTGERTALNFAQTLSATATTVNHYARILDTYKTQILDTRKTLPGLRYGQKYAVTCGGGANHRIGLYDRFLIKENHIMGCGSISAAIQKARQMHSDLLVEVEVESLTELQEALHAGADIIMLDNFSLSDVITAVAINKGQSKLEVSGNVEASHLTEIAETGVDFVSSGAITKNIRAIDLSLRLHN
ncbi:carboxylating nicotinate-nucleotide diphosphorylase [Planctobacterium marinum]|uniref:carboxylating nicotinate-nucleotide diphosphorylase n=1 Tax=Planctobacterium marinum TaxID=1631968 RepID=UPI001E4E72A7|nr:carboxylating nicotinate-nucleotide diphosphorylase [Planctobacterium marinum]MCC2605406.1 carboxylating nicotinate-nucleotide diphosphorylase [Planctobacterium marinum]